MERSPLIDPVQRALEQAFAGLQNTGAQAPTPPAAAQTLPTETSATSEQDVAQAADDLFTQYPDVQRMLKEIPGVEVKLPPKSGVKPAAAPVPQEVPPEGLDQPLPTGPAPGSEPAKPVDDLSVEDEKVQSELLKHFDVNVEDFVPKDVLDSLHKQALGGMDLNDAIGIAGIAITNPQLAGQMLMQLESRRNAATSQLVNVSQQVGSIKKEAARQIALYMRARQDARARLEKEDLAAQGKEYLERRKAVADFAAGLEKAGLNLEGTGITLPDETTVRDPVKFADWVQASTMAASKALGKRSIMAELTGMGKAGPATLAAKTGADPTAAVSALLEQQGFTPDEIQRLQPTIRQFGETARRQNALTEAKTSQALAASRLSESMADQARAQIKKIEGETQNLPGMKRDKAIQLFNTLQMLQMTQQSELQAAEMALRIETLKPTQEQFDADTKFWQSGSEDPKNAGKWQDPDLVENLSQRVQKANMAIMETSQLLANLQPIAGGLQGTLDISTALQDSGPKIAESMRAQVLSGRMLPRTLPPEVLAEAQGAAADPATWLAYLKQPPIGPDGEPNPVRTAYWAAVVRQIGDALGGAQNPEDIIKLLDAQAQGQPSYADIYAGRDVTLPAESIQTMMNSMQQAPGQGAAQPQGEAP